MTEIEQALNKAEFICSPVYAKTLAKAYREQETRIKGCNDEIELLKSENEKLRAKILEQGK